MQNIEYIFTTKKNINIGTTYNKSISQNILQQTATKNNLSLGNYDIIHYFNTDPEIHTRRKTLCLIYHIILVKYRSTN